MSTFGLAIPGADRDDTWEGIKKQVNTIVTRRLCDLRLLGLRRAAFARSCESIRPILAECPGIGEADAIEYAPGVAGRVCELIGLIGLTIDQTIDQIAAERQIMVARRRRLAVDDRGAGSAGLDQQVSREPGPTEVAELRELEEILMAAIGRLDKAVGQAFLMKMNGASTAELMAAQGVSRTTAFHRIDVAKQALREELKNRRP